MAKSLLLNVLTDVLGNYVEGLTRENLKLGVWSGKIELSNLQLKPSALDQLNLPIRVVKGSLSKLRVKVPWTALESKPVEIFVEGVYLLAAPIDFFKYSADEAKALLSASVATRLKAVEDGVMLAVRNSNRNPDTAAHKASYVQHLTTRILDNLEVTINDVHLRYEDSYTDPGRVFSCGISLEQIILTTTDEAWTAKFVKRDVTNKASTAVHKLGAVRNCAVYWNFTSPAFVDADHLTWQTYMHDTIYRGPNSSSLHEKFSYILEPPNELCVKITHRELCNETTPNIDMQIESSLISFRVDNGQYKQVMLLSKSLGELDRKKQASTYRPRLRPTEDPRGWWRYAFMIIVGRESSHSSKIEKIVLCMKSRAKYIGLVKQKIIGAELKQDINHLEEQLKGFDDFLPLSALILFRELGAKEAVLELQRLREPPTNKKGAVEASPTGGSSSSGLFSGWFSSKSTKQPEVVPSPKISEEEEDVRLLQDLESSLDKLSQEAELAVNQAFSFRARFIASSILRVVHDGEEVASSNIDADFLVETRFNTVGMKFRMHNFSIHDSCSAQPYNPELWSFIPYEDTQGIPPCEIAISVKPSSIDVIFSARPSLITWNRECMNRLLSFLVEGSVPNDALILSSSRSPSFGSIFENATMPKATINLNVDLEAPIIVLPELDGSTQCVVVNMGHLMVKGYLLNDQMKWDAQLSQISIAMPLTRPIFSTIAEETSYLVKPFQVNLSLQNIHRDEADLNISVDIVPFIEADLDALKVARLLKVMFVVLSSLNVPSREEHGLKSDERQNFHAVVQQRRPAMAVKTYPDYSHPKHCAVVKVKVKATLPKILLWLRIGEGHVAKVSFELITATVIQRSVDTCIYFSLNSLTVEDSLRPSSISAVLLAKANEESVQQDLIKGSYFSIQSTASSLYEGYQSEFSIAIATVNVYADHITTSKYKVLAWDLMRSIDQMCVFDTVNDLASSSGAASRTKMSEEVSRNMNGFRSRFSLEQVSLHLLAFNALSDGNASNLDFFEIAFSLNVRSLAAFCTSKAAELSLEGSLRAVEVVDARVRVVDHYYKKLIGGDFHRITSHHHHDDDHFMITFRMNQKPNECNNVQIDVSEVALLFALEPLLQLTETVRSNVDAAMSVVQALTSSNLGKEVANKSSVDKIDVEDNQSALLLSLSVKDPQLMFLEDPKSANSKALVNRCQLFVQLLLNKVDTDDKMVLDISLIESEIFIAYDVIGLKGFRRLLEPMALRLHSSTTTQQQQLISLEIDVAVEHVSFRASLNDLLHSAAVIDAIRQMSSKEEEIELSSPVNEKDRVGGVRRKEEHIIAYKFSYSVLSFEVILINDYHEQNIPLMRLQAKEATFLADGASRQLFGSGSVVIASDYYNLPLAIWEPVVEEWSPVLKVTYDFNGLQVEAGSTDILQINATGEFIKCLVNAAELMKNVGIYDNTTVSSKKRFPLSINNQLGIPVEIFDSQSNLSLLLVQDYNTSIPISISSKGKFTGVDAFYMRFHGDLGEKLADLRHLSCNIRRSKVYQLQPHRCISKLGSDVIIEEVFQHARYNPLKMKWEQPWSQLNDPPEWTNVAGENIGDLSAFPCPKGWIWIEQWKVDMSGVVGRNIDEDGWEYAVNFNFFLSNSSKRTKLPTDSVRRRKWKRTRSMVRASGEDDPVLKCAYVVWDVVVHNDETKEIRIMTTTQICNELSLEVELGIQQDDAIIFTMRIPPKATVSLPLQYAIVTSTFRLRPFNLGMDWSKPLSMTFIRELEDERVSYEDIVCTGASCSANMLLNIREHRFLRVTLIPPMNICNRLPCAITALVSSNGSKAGIESFDVTSGGDVPIFSIKPSGDLRMQLRIGQYSTTCSFGVALAVGDVKEIKCGLQKSYEDHDVPFFLNVLISKTTQGSLQIVLYCECLIVDHRFFTAKTVPSEILPEHWTGGANGLQLARVRDGNITLLSNDMKSNLPDISLKSLGQQKSNLQLMDTTFRNMHNIAIKLEPFALAPDLSHILSVMYSVHVINYTERVIILRQKALGSSNRSDVIIPPKACQPWYSLSEYDDTNVRICSEGTEFSLGSIDVNAIGTTVLYLPGANNDNDGIVINVEVRFSLENEPSYTTVTIWESRIAQDQHTKAFRALTAIGLLIRNDCPIAFLVQQSKLDSVLSGTNLNKYRTVVLAGERKPFGWADQDLGSQISLFLHDPVSTKPIITVDTTNVGVEKFFFVSNQKFRVLIKAYSSGKMICLEPVSIHCAIQSPRMEMEGSNKDFMIKINAGIVGFSFIAECPTRRELLATYLQGMEFSLYQFMPADSSLNDVSTLVIEFQLEGIQMDNYAESAVYPVLLYPNAKAKKLIDSGEKSSKSTTSSLSAGSKSMNDTLPSFIQLSLVMEKPTDQSTSIIKYVAFRMLETVIRLDSASAIIFVCDLYRDFVDVQSSLQSSSYSLELQANNFNSNLARPLQESSLYDIEKQYQASRGNKIFYEQIVIHPIKLVVSFYPTHFPRPVSSIPAGMKWMQMLENISAVEDMDLKINSFIARNALESPNTLATRIINKVVRDMQANLFGLAGNLIGSLSLLGKPAGLYKNIGEGVQDFFYEPYTALMESPMAFAKGMTKGTGSLVSGVATGVVGSTTTIIGSATTSVNSLARGVASLTGDETFLKRRDEKMRQMKSSRGGVLSGFKAGGESLFSGFSSGISDLVKKPLEESKKAGALGFFKGVGQGLVGVAVKPVMGVTEGISNVAMGINNQISNASRCQQVRPARALLKRDAQDVDLVLSPLDLFAANAQAYILQRAVRRRYKDTFFVAFTLGYQAKDANEKNTFGLVLSARLLVILNKECTPLWKFDMPTLSHVAISKSAEERYFIEIFEYGQSVASDLKRIFCFNKAAAYAAYRKLYRFRSRFGNPSVMVSLDETKQKLLALSPSNHTLAEDLQTSSPIENSVDRKSGIPVSNQYVFGTANTRKHSGRRKNEQEVINSTKLFFLTLPFLPPVEDRPVYHKILDEALWGLIGDWQGSHDMLVNASRCCVCLIINYANSAVTIDEVELKEGVDAIIMGVNQGYDSQSKSILANGGAVVLFAYGRRPTIISKEHVKVIIKCTAFRSQVTTREFGSECNAQAGFSCAFLEKTRTDWWAKYVISIA